MHGLFPTLITAGGMSTLFPQAFFSGWSWPCGGLAGPLAAGHWSVAGVSCGHAQEAIFRCGGDGPLAGGLESGLCCPG